MLCCCALVRRDRNISTYTRLNDGKIKGLDNLRLIRGCITVIFHEKGTGVLEVNHETFATSSGGKPKEVVDLIVSSVTVELI